jgi:lipopolysaccharide export system permease protein
MIVPRDLPIEGVGMHVHHKEKRSAVNRGVVASWRTYVSLPKLATDPRTVRMRTSIADRYIVQELFAPFLLCVGAFVVILAGDILYTLAEFIASRQVGVGTVVELLIYKLPAILVITFPVSTLVGGLLGLGRLAKDREIQAMRLGGISLVRIFMPVLAFGLLMTVATFIINEIVAPWANYRANAVIRKAAFGEAFPQIREQVFFRGPGNRVYYVGTVDDAHRELHNVMIYELEGSIPRLITAESATWEGRMWYLRGGVIRELDERGFTRYEAGFAKMEISVGIEAGAFSAGQKTPEEMTARDLRQYLSLFGQSPGSARFAVEYYRKFAVPFASAVFALLAAPLGARAVQGGRFVGVGVSIALLFVYYVLMSVARAMGTAAGLAPYLAAWAPNLCFGVAGLWLWASEEGWLARLLPRLTEVHVPP